MSSLDVRPQVVDVAGYAGDTLTIRILAPDFYGLDWSAQVRAAPDTTTVAATFEITAPAAADQPAILVLDAATTRALADTGEVIRVRRGAATVSVLRFTGVWDCQVSDAGSDPVRTLVQGGLTIDLDVTREQVTL